MAFSALYATAAHAETYYCGLSPHHLWCETVPSVSGPLPSLAQATSYIRVIVPVGTAHPQCIRHPIWRFFWFSLLRALRYKTEILKLGEPDFIFRLLLCLLGIDDLAYTHTHEGEQDYKLDRTIRKTHDQFKRRKTSRNTEIF
jgi:hypothetical protein